MESLQNRFPMICGTWENRRSSYRLGNTYFSNTCVSGGNTQHSCNAFKFSWKVEILLLFKLMLTMYIEYMYSIKEFISTCRAPGPTASRILPNYYLSTHLVFYCSCKDSAKYYVKPTILNNFSLLESNSI